MKPLQWIKPRLKMLGKIMWANAAIVATLFCFSLSSYAKTLRVNLVNYPPRSIQGPPASGTSVELLNFIFEGTDYEIKYVFVPWARTFANLKVGKADMLLFVPKFASDDFIKEVDSGKPIFNSLVSLFYNKKYYQGATRFNTLSEFKGKKVGTLIKAATIDFFNDAGLRVHQATNQVSLFNMLLRGRLDFVESEDVSGLAVASTFPPAQNRLIGIVRDPIAVMPVHLAISRARNDYSEIRRVVNEKMKEIIANGIYHKIFSKNYGGLDVPPLAIPTGY